MSAGGILKKVTGRDEPTLTPAASEALELNADLFKRQVLHELSRRYKNPGYRVRVSDVQGAVAQVAAAGPRNLKVVPLVAKVAVSLSMATLVIQVIIQSKLNSRAWGIGVAAVLVGVSTGATVVMLFQEARRRRLDRAVASGGFLREIQALEWAARRIAEQAIGDSAKTSSLLRILSALEVLAVWTPEESQTFRELLSIRNAIVHEDARGLSPAEINFGLSQTARLSGLIRARKKELEHAPERGRPRSSRAALSYEERVVSALHGASFSVIDAQGAHKYDLLAETSAGTVAIVVEYRKGDSLEIDDLLPVAAKRPVGVPIVVVTDASPSPTARKYLKSPDALAAQINVVTWLPDEPEAALVKRIKRAAVEMSSTTLN
jgi:pimeloyl-ACP methyl ester carboxylesterase